MKGLLPYYFRPAGYLLLVFSALAPMFMLMGGMVDASNLNTVKGVVKLVVWFSLFMIFLSKIRHGEEDAARSRSRAVRFALCIFGIYYALELCFGISNGNVAAADTSAPTILMALVVTCNEFEIQRLRIERINRRRRL